MHTVQQIWEKKATVRNRPRITIDPEGLGSIYPINHQFLACHSKIVALEKNKIEFLLTQSFYKYTNDITLIETSMVNNTILKILRGELDLNFNNEQKLNLLTIMVDESYHAYVAYDAMLQIEQYTGIKPLPMPKTIELELALNQIFKKIEQKYHGLFQFIAICIAENTLSLDIVNLLHQKDTHPFFQNMLTNHLADEGRHSGIFLNLLTDLWSDTPTETKNVVLNILPEFISLYLGTKIQQKFEKKLLLSMGFNEDQSNEILTETYSPFKVTQQHPMMKNILNVLTKANVLIHN